MENLVTRRQIRLAALNRIVMFKQEYNGNN